MFEKGRVYRRNQLHREWDGERELQRQGGILTPRGQPFIVLVTGARGQRYGYEDEWVEGVFHYYGAGQHGPMKWVRGNRAIRDSGKDIHLFEDVTGGIRYWGQLDYAGWEYRTGTPDRAGRRRRAIVFFLTPHEGDAGEEPEGALTHRRRRRDPRWSKSLTEMRRRARRRRKPRGAREAKRLGHERSRDVAVYVLMRANGSCEGCGTEGPFRTRALPERPYLEPHHVERLSDGGPDHPARVIALCPNCHRRVHHGVDGDEYNAALKRRLRQIEGPAPRG
jgi:5-methylcytosine-specific restriction protein A